MSAAEVPATVARNPRRDRETRCEGGGSATAPSTGSASASRGRREGSPSERLVSTHFAPMCATRAPIVTQAIQKCEAVKENRHGCHWAMFATPENTIQMLPATSARIPMRSTRCASPLTGGKERNRGQTSQSLASRTGTDAIPVAT